MCLGPSSGLFPQELLRVVGKKGLITATSLSLEAWERGGGGHRPTLPPGRGAGSDRKLPDPWAPLKLCGVFRVIIYFFYKFGACFPPASCFPPPRVKPLLVFPTPPLLVRSPPWAVTRGRGDIFHPSEGFFGSPPGQRWPFPLDFIRRRSRNPRRGWGRRRRKRFWGEKEEFGAGSPMGDEAPELGRCFQADAGFSHLRRLRRKAGSQLSLSREEYRSGGEFFFPLPPRRWRTCWPPSARGRRSTRRKFRPRWRWGRGRPPRGPPRPTPCPPPAPAPRSRPRFFPSPLRSPNRLLHRRLLARVRLWLLLPLWRWPYFHTPPRGG